MIEKRDMKIFGKVILYSLLVIIVAIGGYFYYWNNIFYLNYDNIDDIVYAEPSERAKNFDIDGYINSLPELEYEKVEYPVKETYEYKFNGYKMTIDIPEGFMAYEMPLDSENRKIYNTKNMEDSCVKIPGFATVCAPKNIFWSYLLKTGQDGGLTILSSDKLCISERKYKSEFICDGLIVEPYKSKYVGISTRDFYYRTNIVPKNESNERYFYDIGTDKKQHKIDGKNALVMFNAIFYSTNLHYSILLNDDQGLSFGISNDLYNSSNFDNNLYSSIISSMKIAKE